MEKIKSVISFIDNLLGKFRRVFLNILTVLFLMLLTFGFVYSLGSLFESDKVETADQILYLEPSGMIVDKAITINGPFEEFEVFGNSTNQIELENFLKVIKNAGTDDDLKAICKKLIHDTESSRFKTFCFMSIMANKFCHIEEML